MPQLRNGRRAAQRPFDSHPSRGDHMEKKIQAKHVSDESFLQVIDSVREKEKRWTHTWDLVECLGFPERIIRAKAASLIRRKVITGCACGCRGDFERVADG